MKKFLVSALRPDNVESVTILQFFEGFCDYLNKRFPEDKLANYIVFDSVVIANATRFDYHIF